MNKFYFKPIKQYGESQGIVNRNESFFKTIKILILSVAFLITGIGNVWGQTVVTVPSANTNTGSVNDPLGGYFGFERTALIYTSAQIGSTTGLITSVGFYLNSVSTPGNAVNVRVYMKMRTTLMTSNSTYATEISGATLVYGPTTISSGSFTANNWVNLALTTPFNYTGGTNHLEVIIETNATGAGNEGTTGKQFRYSSPGNNQHYQYWNADNSAPTGNGTRSANRPNIQLTFATPSTAPTSITGTNSICTGGSTNLTTSGGSLGTDAVDLWSSGSCLDHAYFNPWYSNQFTSGSQQTTFNSSATGILNVTSTGGDPFIHMPSLGSFNPNNYRYVNVRFRATSVAQPGGIEIFWYNTLYTGANGAQYKNQAVSSTQNVWTTVSIDMLTPTAGDWLHSNVTGWRFDWATTTGVTMEIDFISLSNVPIVGEGTSVSVSPTSTTTYYTQKAGLSNRTSCASQAITVNGLPSAGTVTSSPASGPICAGTSVTASVSGGSGGAGTITDAIEYSSNGGAWTAYSGAVSAAANSLQFRTRRSATGSGCTTSGYNTATSITVNSAPTANAGTALSNICRGTSSAQMGGSVGGGATGGTWSGGSGTWTNATNPSTAVYNAAANESGTITLTLTATAPGGCTNVTATKSLTFTAVSATPTITGPICPGNTTVTGTGVNGSTIKIIRGGSEIQSGSATWSGSNWSITVSTVSAGESLTATQLESGKCVSDASSAYVVITPASWGNIQFPATSQTICGSPVTFYGQVYRAGTTEAAGQGVSLTADLGWSSSNTNPNTWTNWTPATFNAQSGNNDEFSADLGSGLTEGTWYYAFRYSYAGCPIYGGYGGVYGSGGSNGTATVPASQTISLSSSAGTNAQTVCKGSAITNITYSVGNGATGAGVSGLPTGVSGSFSGGTYTITGTPSVSGVYNYTVTTSGPSNCIVFITGTITVSETLDFANLQFPSTATICQGATANVFGQVYEAGLTEAGGQGAGVTVHCGVNATNTNPNTWATWTAASFNAQSGNNDEYIAAIGSSLSAGTYYYAFRYSYNGCVVYGGYSGSGGGFWDGSTNVSGVLTVNPTNTAGSASSTPTVCINASLTTITHTTTSATGISNAGVSGANGLPAGVSASWSSNTISITGTPSASGTFNYSIPLTGGCGTVNATGTIIVSPVNSAGAASSTPTLCNNSPLTTITHSTIGATGISNAGVSGANGLPAGVSASWSSNTISISGTPTVAGTYNYSISLTGGCGSANATGTITVNTPTVNPITGTTTICVGQTSALGGNTTPFTVQSFTSVGTTSFIPPVTGSAEVLVVAGGGGGGFGRGGGGGGGGVIYNGSYSVTAGTPITVTVGGGGTGAANNTSTSSTGNGANSVFGIITATGGGLGGSHNPGTTSFNNGSAGGSGGGAAINYSGSSQWTGGTASPAGQGFAGGAGAGSTDSPRNTGGGGGAGAVGVSPGTSTSTPPNGGVGLSYSITGSAVFYGGGGGGANGNASGESYTTAGAGTGGNGGGGNGAAIGGNPTSGAANTGGGGGGGSGGGSTGVGGNGGSGIVIVRYPTATWSWTSSNPSVATVNVSTGVVTAVAPGTTTITFTLTSGGCSNSVTTTVTVNATPTASASSNTPVCQGNTLNLTGTTNIGTTFSWSGPNSFTSSSQNPSITNLTAAAAGTYTFTATFNGCSASGTTTVVATAAATNVNAGSDVAVCAGTGTSLSASSTAPSLPTVNTYNGGAITINAAGNASVYPSTVSVSGLTGNITNIRLSINNFSHTFPSDVDVVLFGPTGAHSIIFTDALTSSTISGRNYTFQIGATALSTIASSASGTYDVVNGGSFNGTGTPSAVSSTNLNNFVGTNPNGTWSLYVFDDASGDAGSIGSWSIEITSNEPAAVAYSWSPATFLSATNVANPTASGMLSTQTYTVTATSNGCSNTDQVVVTVNNPTVTTTRNANDFVWTGGTSTAWNVTSNWLQWSGSAYTIPAGFPNSNTANVILPTDNANGGTCVPNEARIGAYTIAINNLTSEANHAFQLNNANARLNIFGTITNGGTWNTPTAGSIVDYAASGNQNILNAVYSNLQTSGSGIKTLIGTTTVNLVLTVGSGTEFNLSNRILRLTNATTEPIVNNGTWTHGTSTVDFRSASNQTIPSLTYHNLFTNGLNTGGTKTINGTVSVNNILTLNDGTSLVLGSNTLNLGGATPIAFGPLVTGSINIGTSTVNYSGTGDQAVSALAYHNLGTTGTGVKTLTGATSVTNTLALTDGVLTLGANTLTLNGSTMTRSSGSIDASNASATLAFGNASLLTLPASVFSAAVNNLTLAGTRVKATSDFSVNGILNLNASNPDATNGLLDLVQSYGTYGNTYSVNSTDSYNNLSSAVLTLGPSSTVTGDADITGKVRRTSFTDGVTYAFGNKNMQLTFDLNGGASLPTQITVVATKGDEGLHIDKDGTSDYTPGSADTLIGGASVKRLWQVLKTGGSSEVRFDIRFPYDDSELNGNTEADLVTWDHHLPYSGRTPHEHGKTNVDATNNWVELSGHGIGYLATEGDVSFTKYWMLSENIIKVPTWLGAAGGGSTGDWNTASNWTNGIVPTSSMSVLIPDAVSTAHDPDPLKLPSTIEVGTLEIQAGGILDGGSSEITITGGPAINGGRGSWLNNGTFTPSTSKVIFDYTDATIAGSTVFYDLTVNTGKKATVQANSSLSIAGTIVNDGTFDASSHVNLISYTGSGQSVINPNGTTPGYSNLKIDQSSGTATASGQINVLADLTIDNGSFDMNNSDLYIEGDLVNNSTLVNNTQVFMSGTGAQSIEGTSSTTFDILQLTGTSGTTTLNQDINVTTILYVEGSKILNGGNYEISLNGSGTPFILDGTFNAGTGTVNYTSVDPTDILPITYYNLKSEGSVTKTLLGNTVVGNALTLDGTLLDASTHTLSIGSSPITTNSGSLKVDAGTLELTNVSDITIPTTLIDGNVINNLTLSGAGGTTLSDNISITGDLTMNTGLLKLGSTTLTLETGSTMSSTGGLLNSETGGLLVKSTDLDASALVSGSINNLEIERSGGVALSGDLIITGEYKLTSGNFDIASNRLTLSGTINHTSGGIDADNGTVDFNNATLFSLPTTFFATNVNNMELNGVGGIALSESVKISNQLDMNEGDITVASGKTLEIGTSITTLADINWVKGTVIGQMKRWYGTAANSTAARGMLPVGTSDYNRYVRINFTEASSGGYILAEYKMGMPDNMYELPLMYTNPQGLRRYIQNADETGYWDITPYDENDVAYASLDNVKFDMVLRINNPDATQANGPLNDPPTMRIIRAKGNPGAMDHEEWSLGSSIATITSVPGSTLGTDYTVKSVDMQGFSWFNIGGDNSSPLPIELISFTGFCNDNQATINWKTASEFNSSYYTVEKSTDGQNWRVVNNQVAAGISSEELNYQFVDENTNEDDTYYRLSQFDIDGEFTVYDPIFVSCNEKSSFIKTYPNPSDASFQVLVNNSSLIGKATIQLVDTKGTTVSMKEVEITEGTNLFYLNENMAPGIYYLSISNGITTTEVIKHSVK